MGGWERSSVSDCDGSMLKATLVHDTHRGEGCPHRVEPMSATEGG